MYNRVIIWGFSSLVTLLMVSAAPALAQPSSVVEQAREAARSDRNREAADLFKQALASDPSLRRQLLHELADQLTYSDRAAEAVPLYREVLAWPDLSEEDRWRAKRGLALALAWSGQHQEAVQAYSELLERDPNDRDARLNRGKVQGWRHRYGAAERDLRLLLARDPNDAEARRALAEVQSLRGHARAARKTLEPLLGSDADARTLFLLARAEHWSGRSDLAGPTLARSSALAADSEAAVVRRDIALARAPLTEVRARYSDQSDRTNISRFTALQSFTVGDDNSRMGLQYDVEHFDAPVGADVTVHRPGVHGRLLLSDSFSLSAEGAIALQRAEGDRDSYALFNVYGTVMPSDLLRFDFGVARQAFDSVRSLLLGIRSTDYGASVDVGSDAGWKGMLRTNYSNISDGNSRWWAQAEVRRRVAWTPNWFLGFRATKLGFDDVRDNGYFNPKRLEAAEGLTQLWGRLGRGYFDLRGTLGVENSDPGGGRLTYSAEAKITQPLTRAIEVEATANSFNSQHNATGGFSRKTIGVTLRARW